MGLALVQHDGLLLHLSGCGQAYACNSMLWHTMLLLMLKILVAEDRLEQGFLAEGVLPLVDQE